MADFTPYTDHRTRTYVFPTRILKVDGAVQNAEQLLTSQLLQPVLGQIPCSLLQSTPEAPAGVLLDFGRELCGCVKLVTCGVHTPTRRIPVRITLGESVAEALSDVNTSTATNDHALRDTVYDVGFMSAVTTGESGFRFAYISLPQAGTLELAAVAAVSLETPLPRRGSFHSSDPLLDRIWETAVRTVHLNMQELLWDGIKRDRLVWVGDMHTELMTVLAAFGDVSLVHRTLDFIGEATGSDYMNGMYTYSMWWVLLQYELYLHTGDLAFLTRHRGYLTEMLRRFASHVGENGRLQTEHPLFFNHYTLDHPQMAASGVYGRWMLTRRQGEFLCRTLGDCATADLCAAAHRRMAGHIPATDGYKGSEAFLSLAELKDAAATDRLLATNGVQDYSGFLGYYLLAARARAGNVVGALNDLRAYWGGMLQMGATSFWEDFDIAWMKGAAPIDRLPLPGERDIHGGNGLSCYVGYRHSLCHGWSSGPCPFLTRHVLGVRAAAVGMTAVTVTPHLGDLAYAEGTVPTPHGDLHVSHRQTASGIQTELQVPAGVTVLTREPLGLI